MCRHKLSGYRTQFGAESVEPAPNRAEASRRQHTERVATPATGFGSSPQEKKRGETLSKTVAGVAGPVGVRVVCRASSHPFGECAQLETVGHNPRTACHGREPAVKSPATSAERVK